MSEQVETALVAALHSNSYDPPTVSNLKKKDR